MKRTFEGYLYSGNLANIRNTYKELKQSCLCDFSTITFTILEIPIRNWNLLKSFFRICLISDIRNTYKELKHMQSNISRPSFSILEIPIRNWNFQMKSGVRFPYGHIRNTYKELKLKRLWHFQKIRPGY